MNVTSTMDFTVRMSFTKALSILTALESLLYDTWIAFFVGSTEKRVGSIQGTLYNSTYPPPSCNSYRKVPN